MGEPVCIYVLIVQLTSPCVIAVNNLGGWVDRSDVIIGSRSELLPGERTVVYLFGLFIYLINLVSLFI